MRHAEASARINAPIERVFAYLNDHARLSSHMSQSSWMMGGGRMDVSVDEGRGQRVGSHIRLSGKAFGLPIQLDEVVTRYEPPRIKAWETVGAPQLWVIGYYRMQVELTPDAEHALLRVAIDYDLPSRRIWLGRLFGRTYARWCVQQMLHDARKHFSP